MGAGGCDIWTRAKYFARVVSCESFFEFDAFNQLVERDVLVGMRFYDRVTNAREEIPKTNVRGYG